MAEDKKPTRAERMYGKGNKIKDAGGDAQTEIKKPHAEAEKTAGEPEKDKPAPKEAAKPAGGGELDMAGTGENVPRTEVHGREMRDMHDRHRAELRDTHTRHEREHRAMMGRHLEEMGHEGDKKGEEPEGKSGTEPEKKAA